MATETGSAQRRPPGPRGGPFGIRHALRSERDILGFMTDLGSYGDLAYFRVGPIRAHLVNHPELLRELLIDKANLIRKLPHQTKVMGQIEGNGMLVSDGEHWRRQRRLLQPAFHARRIEKLVDAAVEETRRTMESWQPGGTIEIVPAMTDLSMVVMAKSFFGLDLTTEAPQFRQIVRDVSEALLLEMRRMVRLPRWSITPVARRKWRAIDALDALVWDLVRRQRGAANEDDSLLALLLKAVDPESGSPAMTEQEARDEAVTMFNAGHDTTAAALAWILYAVTTHPAVGDRLKAEVDEVLAGAPPVAGDIARLPYVEAVVNEALRLYPPGWSLFTRQAMETFDLGGWRIPAGAWLIAMPWVTHRDRRFFAEPLKFDPERFLPGRAEAIPRFAFFPFGIGAHTCIGMRLSTVEMVAMVALMFQRRRFRLADPSQPEHIEPLLSIWPRADLKLTVEAV